jgi:hypothetical protein
MDCAFFFGIQIPFVIGTISKGFAAEAPGSPMKMRKVVEMENFQGG